MNTIPAAMTQWNSLAGVPQRVGVEYSDMAGLLSGAYFAAGLST